jgi:nucleotide-binding universal stress UspA family protein
MAHSRSNSYFSISLVTSWHAIPLDDLSRVICLKTVVFFERCARLFQKILVPLDGSEHSLKALEIAAQLAEKFSGKITLIHVYSVSMQPVMMPEPSTSGSLGMPILTNAEISRMIEATQKFGNRILDDGEQKVKTEKVQMKKLLIEGHAVQEIVRLANEDRYDLIVIGARGISHVREILLGSVTDGVIHHVRCPVLVIK